MGLGITAPTYFVGSQDHICSTVVAARIFVACRDVRLSIRQSKSEMREKVLGVRDALPVETRISYSLNAAELVGDRLKFLPGTIISAFFPIRSEIDPRPLMDKLRQRGAILCLPVVADKTTILFRELVRGAALVDTGFGTRGPGDDARIVDPMMMIMPLSVFDKQGGRIGYGAGHYDRAIARLEAKGVTPRLIGMAFSLQQVDLVSQEPHDKVMDAIITEKGYREFD